MIFKRWVQMSDGLVSVDVLRNICLSKVSDGACRTFFIILAMGDGKSVHISRNRLAALSRNVVTATIRRRVRELERAGFLECDESDYRVIVHEKAS
jgi:hypothetical protein